MNALLLACFLATAPAWDNPHAPRSLNAAHQAFLEENYPEMMAQLRTTLRDHQEDDVIRENALALLQKAYDINKGRLPGDLILPDAITGLRVGVTRRARADSVEYSTRIGGETVRPKAIRQLRLVRHPDTVILDLRAGVGEWEDLTVGTGGEFELSSLCQPLPVPDGLYRITISLDDGSEHQGELILGDLVSSESPRVAAPLRGSHVGYPVKLAWEDFRSPQHRAYEARGLWMAVARVEPPQYQWEELWSTYIHQPSVTEFVLGDDGKLPVKPGRHVFTLNYSESRRQGAITIQRRSASTVPFVIDGR